MYDIIIPSCKAYEDVNLFVEIIKITDNKEYNYIPTGMFASASCNRNYGIRQALKSDNEYIIMIDDDIGGFYEGWQDDLVSPLKYENNIKISSARLITPTGGLSPMNGVDFNINKQLSIAPKMILSAAIAFRKCDIDKNYKLRFCMDMVGSGYEDTLFCRMFVKELPGCYFVANNGCRLIHYHEMKKQSEYLNYNHNIYLRELKKEGLHE